MKPYIEETLSENVVIRKFSPETDWSEFTWHWDDEDRIVDPVNDNDWQFQFDNELPMRINKQIIIPRGVIHRVIPGTTDLVVQINKNNGTH
jgi:hypothetical protein